MKKTEMNKIKKNNYHKNIGRMLKLFQGDVYFSFVYDCG